MSDFAKDTNVPINDCISRQAAIDAIRASTSKYTGFMEMEMYTDDDATKAIEGLPSAQQWIPVTERLPEVDENVLVSYHFQGESEFFPSHDGVTISYWTGVKNHNIPYFGDLGDASTVLAWMPLPKPWEGGAE